MKKRDPKKQAKLERITTKRALYEKTRKRRLKAQKNQVSSSDTGNES